ncbi:MAG: hypothetical protein LUH11_02970 [Candidatus Gastranaerophilales bacterium]|nr:hypothetical protein [Candidatus Gastranaerophilales bacterium]
MITFLDLYNECSGQPWSMFDNDAENIEDFETAMKISINKAISFLWNYQPWSFRFKQQTLKTKKTRNNYSLPNGLISKKTINGKTRYGVRYDGNFLSYASDYELLEESTGEPEQFYISGENLYIYPTPDDTYTITIDYLLLPFALSSKGIELYELSNNDDYINIPEKYEVLFKNCLISLAMIYAIADESDENHSGYLKQYEDSLAILLKYCKNSILDRNIVW